MGEATRYSASEKLEILHWVWELNLSVRHAVRQIGISRGTYYEWLDRYQHGGLAGLENRRRRPDGSGRSHAAQQAEVLAIASLPGPLGARTGGTGDRQRRVLRLGKHSAALAEST